MKTFSFLMTLFLPLRAPVPTLQAKVMSSHTWCIPWLLSLAMHSPYSSHHKVVHNNQYHVSSLLHSIRERNICRSLNVGLSQIVSPSPTVPQWPICYWRGHTNCWLWKSLQLRFFPSRNTIPTDLHQVSLSWPFKSLFRDFPWLLSQRHPFICQQVFTEWILGARHQIGHWRCFSNLARIIRCLLREWMSFPSINESWD